MAKALDMDDDGQVSLPEFLSEFPAPSPVQQQQITPEPTGCLCQWACPQAAACRYGEDCPLPKCALKCSGPACETTAKQPASFLHSDTAQTSWFATADRYNQKQYCL